MITTYVVIGLVSAALLVACAAAQPSSPRSQERIAARRRSFVEKNPTQVNSYDILCSLVRDGVELDQARFITEKAAAHGIKPFTMWLWLEQYDAEVLGVVVAADLTHRELLTHISNGTVPDLDELRIFASANGLTEVGARVTVRRKVLVDSGPARKRPPVPPIYEPGTWPGDASARTSGRRGDGLAA